MAANPKIPMIPPGRTNSNKIRTIPIANKKNVPIPANPETI